MRPFTAQSFANGIGLSHANIGPMAIAVLEDGSGLASGGLNRGHLFRFPFEGGDVDDGSGELITSLPYPVFDMAFDAQGTLRAVTGGGPLLALDPDTGEILQEIGDGLTQSLAIHPENDLLYLSSGNGIEIFDPITASFRHFSDLRVGNLRFAPDGSLWATTWPNRGSVVRFDGDDNPQLMLQFDTLIDSIAFGQPGTDLAGLLFVSSNGDRLGKTGGSLIMVDLATLDTVTIAQGGTRGDIIQATADGRVLLSQSNQIDVLGPIIAPRVTFTNPPADAIIALPRGSVSITFDQDMNTSSGAEPGSVLAAWLPVDGCKQWRGTHPERDL